MKKTFTYTYTPALLVLIAITLCIVPYAGAQTQEAPSAQTSAERNNSASPDVGGGPHSITAAIQNRMTNLTENVIERLTSTVVRQNNIINRLHTRIEKLSTQGIDTSEAKARLDEVEKLHTETITRINNIDSNINSNTTNLREKFVVFRTEVLEIRQMLRGVHQLLLETVSLLRSEVSMNQQESVADVSGQYNDGISDTVEVQN